MKFIIRDYPQLYKESSLDQFFMIPPRDKEASARAKEQLIGREYPRKQLKQILKTYNDKIGNDAIAIKNSEKIVEKDSFCIITGQQLGLMGGPAFTILKGISCLLIARQMGAIPIFWLATEDHDIGEVDHTFLVDNHGNLKRYPLAFPRTGMAVEDLKILPEHLEIIQTFFQDLNLKEEIEWLQKASLKGSYTELMIPFLLKLFSGTGLVFLEPYLLRPLAKVFFQREIEESDLVIKTLRTTKQHLLAAGGVPILSIEEGTNLFFKSEADQRCKIQKQDSEYIVGKKLFSKNQLIDLIHTQPERFSTNVAARPVLQSMLLPTLAYVAGPTEMAYLMQLKDYYHYHKVPMPWIVPRLSATLITPDMAKYLSDLHLQPWEEIPKQWHALLGLSQEVDKKRGKELAREQLDKRGVPFHSLHCLHNFLHPRQQLQERVLNWWGFQAKAKENLVQEFLKKCHWQTGGHTYCWVGEST